MRRSVVGEVYGVSDTAAPNFLLAVTVLETSMNARVLDTVQHWEFLASTASRRYVLFGAPQLRSLAE